MKHILTIIVLASALAWTAGATGITTSHSRSNEVPDTAAPAPKTEVVPAPTTESTPVPACGEGEYYDPLMQRCRRPEDSGPPAEPGEKWGLDGMFPDCEAAGWRAGYDCVNGIDYTPQCETVEDGNGNWILVCPVPPAP